jgi:hypothetical protein
MTQHRTKMKNRPGFKMYDFTIKFTIIGYLTYGNHPFTKYEDVTLMQSCEQLEHNFHREVAILQEIQKKTIWNLQPK